MLPAHRPPASFPVFPRRIRPASAGIGAGDAAAGSWLRRLARLYWRRRLLLGGAVVAMVAVTFAIVQRIPPRFQSSATVMLDPRQHTVIDIPQVVTPFRPDELAVESEIQVMLSQDLARTVIAATGVASSAEFNPAVERQQRGAEPADDTPLAGLKAGIGGAVQWVRDALGTADAPPSPERDVRRDELVMLQRFAKALEVRPVGRSRVIGVSFTARDPDLAAAVANAVVDAYLAQQSAGRIRETERANGWLRQRAQELRAEAAKAQKAYTDRMTAAQSSAGVDQQLLRDQLLDINRTLAVAEADLNAARNRRTQLESLLEAGRLEPLAAMARSDTMQAIRLRLVDLQRDMADRSGRLGPLHPSVTALAAQIRSTRDSLAIEARRLVADARGDEAALQDRAASLRAAAEDHQRELRQQQDATADVATLEREAKSTEDLYNTFLTRFKETSAGTLSPPEAWMVSRALPAADPVFPNTPLLLGFAGIAALGLAGAGVTLREMMHTGLRSAEEVEGALGLRGLGLSPALPRRLTGRALVEDLLKHPRSAFAESVRIIVSNAIGPLRPDNGAQVVSVCSACPHEGKSTLVAAAATLLSISGFRVLVIDADMRWPSQHGLFAVPNRDGLSDDLHAAADAGSAGLFPADQDVPLPTVDPVTGVHVLTGGLAGAADARGPMFLGHAERLDHLIGCYRQSYDIILLDMPPCMPVADARIFAILSDRCLFVTRWHATPAATVRAALGELRGAGVDIAGLALLQVDVREHATYEYGDSGLYRRHGRYTHS